MNAPFRPLVRYHGGKWQLAEWIISHFPPHRVYVEPFGGGGSVLLRKRPAEAEVYNDLDREMVNLFRVCRDHGDDLARRLALTPYAREELESSYEPCPADPVEWARRTVVRGGMGFAGGITRTVASGELMKMGFRSTTKRRPAPCVDWERLPYALPAIVARMRGVVVENRPADEVMKAHDGPETLHYVDPPYVFATRDKGRDYRFELDDDGHVQLADVLKSLTGAVVLSGYRSDLYDDLFPDWQRIEKRTMADGARERVECLWLSPNMPKGGLDL